MGVKVTKVVITDDNGAEQILNAIDGTMLIICEGLTADQTRVLTQTSSNNNINMELMRRILAPVTNQTPVVDTTTEVEVPAEAEDNTASE